MPSGTHAVRHNAARPSDGKSAPDSLALAARLVGEDRTDEEVERLAGVTLPEILGLRIDRMMRVAIF